MSLYSKLQTTTKLAHSIFAQTTGATAGETNATIAGVPVLVVCDPSRRGEELMMGGRIVTLAMTASANRNQTAFDNLVPVEGMAFVYDGETYKILSREKDSLRWNFILGHPSQ